MNDRLFSAFQSLEISDCDYVTDVGIMDGVLSGTPKKDLRELNLSLLKDLGEPVVTRLSYFYENLNVLDLGAVTLAVTDNSLQMILRHMTFLRYLNVDSCCKVSNLALKIFIRNSTLFPFSSLTLASPESSRSSVDASTRSGT